MTRYKSYSCMKRSAMRASFVRAISVDTAAAAVSIFAITGGLKANLDIEEDPIILLRGELK